MAKVLTLQKPFSMQSQFITRNELMGCLPGAEFCHLPVVFKDETAFVNVVCLKLLVSHEYKRQEDVELCGH